MTTRIVAATLGLVLAAALGGVALAQESDEVPAPIGANNADGAYVVADDDANPNVSGEGESRTLGDIDTGGTDPDPVLSGDGAALPDPAAIRDATDAAIRGADDGADAAPPAAADVPAADPAPAVDPAAAVAEPAPAPVDPTSTDGAEITMSNEDGETTAIGLPPVPVPVPAASAASPEDSVPAATCADYPSWFEAQIAYEEAGRTDADPALVAALDPDGDGIACEEAMLTS